MLVYERVRSGAVRCDGLRREQALKMERHQGLGAGWGRPSADDLAPVAGTRRRRALEQMRAAVEDGSGPVLITGEPVQARAGWRSG